MTTQELIEYYSGLLILQYANKRKAVGSVQAVVTPVIMDQLPLLVQSAYALESAIGAQLDVLGKYVGASRNVLTFTGPFTLGDDDFRTLIKIRIISNNLGSSLYDIQNILHTFFPTALKVFDYQDMRMDYFFNSAFGSVELAEAFVRQGLLPKPMGVQLGALIYAANLTNLFGCRTYDLPAFTVSGLNTYADYHTDRPFLSYVNAISE